MNKLLTANFYRLKKDKIFWLIAAVTLILQLSMVWNRCHANQISQFESYTLNDAVFELLPFISFVFAVFISLFLCREYSEGTIRNRLIAGHKRESVYLSNFITCLTGALIIYVLFIIAGFAGIPFLGKWQGGADNFALYILVGTFVCTVFASIFTMISMLVTNGPITVVLSITVALVMLISSSMMYQMLGQPEFTREFISMSIDNVEFGPEIPNPAYVSGIKRELFGFFGEFLPTGQGILLANGEITHPFFNIAYSAMFSIAVNTIGIFIFKKKDLK